MNIYNVNTPNAIFSAVGMPIIYYCGFRHFSGSRAFW